MYNAHNLITGKVIKCANKKEAEWVASAMQCGIALKAKSKAKSKAK